MPVEPNKQLADEEFRQRVLRARNMTLEEKIEAGWQLFEQECRAMADEIRREHPELDEQQVQARLTQKLNLLRQQDEVGRYGYIVIAPPS
jgi:hypothetical protein